MKSGWRPAASLVDRQTEGRASALLERSCHCSRSLITGGRLPVDLGMEVGERGTQALVQHSHPVLVGCRARLRRVVDEIIGEQFVEHAPVTFALYFLGVSANYGDCCVAHG